MTFRWAPVHHVVDLFHLMMAPDVTLINRHGDELIERARSIAATRFLLETDADVLFSLDSDISFSAEQVFQVCEQAMTHSIVGGLYPTRSTTRCRPAFQLLPDVPVIVGDDPTPIPVRSVGTGFLATHRRVFEAILQATGMQLQQCEGDRPFYPFYFPMVRPRGATWEWVGEDFSFNHRAADAGFKTYLNPAVRLKHYGERAFEFADIAPGPFNYPVRLSLGDDGMLKMEFPTNPEEPANSATLAPPIQPSLVLRP
jgi:hypothetical protein